MKKIIRRSWYVASILCLIGSTNAIANKASTHSMSIASNNAGGKLDIYTKSEPGEPLGQGEQRHFNFDNINLTLGDSLGLSAGDYSFDFHPNAQDGWHVGKYNYAGFSVQAYSGGCIYGTGNFEIFELDYDQTTKNINKLALDFEYHCDGANPALRGAIRFNSDYPVKGYDAPAGYTDKVVKVKCDEQLIDRDNNNKLIGYFCPNMSIHADYHGCGRTIPDNCDTYPVITGLPELTPYNLPQQPFEKDINIRIPNDALDTFSLILFVNEISSARICTVPFANKKEFDISGVGDFATPIDPMMAMTCGAS
jgi:hypothetical protein